MQPRQLVYVTSTGKGRSLFGALRDRYETATLLDLTPRGSGRVVRALARRTGLWQPLELHRRLTGERLTRRIARLVRAGGPADVFVWSPPTAPDERWAGFGRVVAVTDVALDDEHMTAFDVPPGLAARYRADWDGWFRWSDLVLTLSDWAAERNRAMHPAHAGKVVAMGWGPAVPSPADEVVRSAVRRDQVLLVGHDFERKGVDLLERVAAVVHRTRPEVRFVVVGEPGPGFDVGALTHLDVRPPCDAAGVSALMLESKAFVLLSRYEASAHVVVEAQAHGLPVVCSAGGGSGEAVLDGETGRVCPPGDVEATAQALLDVLDDGTNARMSARARAHAVDELEWDRIVDRLPLWR